MTRLFIANLDYAATEDDIRAAFAEQQIGVENVKIILDRETGRPRGFGFLEVDDAAAKNVLALMDGTLVCRRPMRVQLAEKQGPPPGRGGPRREPRERDRR